MSWNAWAIVPGHKEDKTNSHIPSQQASLHSPDCYVMKKLQLLGWSCGDPSTSLDPPPLKHLLMSVPVYNWVSVHTWMHRLFGGCWECGCVGRASAGGGSAWGCWLEQQSQACTDELMCWSSPEGVNAWAVKCKKSLRKLRQSFLFNRKGQWDNFNDSRFS